jgi:hypothetical protein
LLLLAVTSYLVLARTRTAARPAQPLARATAAPSTEPSTARPRAPSTSHTPSPSPTATADATLTALVAGQPPGSVSVEALDPRTGRQFRFGATAGMWTASSIKLDFLEVLLLQHQQTGQGLTDDEAEDAAEMIENSDNGAADEIFNDDDDSYSGCDAANAALGADSTALGTDDYWGLSTTSAADQVALLRDLVESDSPLDADSRSFALGLLRNVEADQAWGVSAAADPGTAVALKNGWLNIDDDDERYVVNSSGIVTVHGQQVLVSVLTQHDPDEDSGIQLVQRIAQVATAAVTSG